MKKILPVLAFTIVSAAHSQQIQNGSFEENGAPTLAGWEWACGDPVQENIAAPGSGSWCATKQPGHAKGCFPSYMFQRLPDLVNGQLVTLHGWVKCGDDVICLGGWIGIGRLSNGEVTYDDLAGTSDPVWTYVNITDTVEIADDDTAVAVLTSGFIGGPISPNPGYFDGISLDVNTGTSELQATTFTSWLDATTRTLYIGSNNAAIRNVRLLDLTGRALPVAVDIANASTARIDVNALPTGVYFARVMTNAGDEVVRFVVP